MDSHDRRVLFSSVRQDWGTPQTLFDDLNAEYGPFVLDVCASKENKKCSHWFGLDKGIDGLTRDWTFVAALGADGSERILGRRCWMNPPYGRGLIRQWVEKAYAESRKGCSVCCLLPSRTDTGWFQDVVLPAVKAGHAEIKFLRGRVKFEGAAHSAPFPSVVVFFHGPRR